MTVDLVHKKVLCMFMSVVIRYYELIMNALIIHYICVLQVQNNNIIA